MTDSPSCPRCGYDLSGVAASWQESCPLTGVCSECGLTVRWAEVLNPRLTVPKWSIEHASNARSRKAVETFFRTMRPASFWRSLRLEHPVVVGRLVKYAATMLILTHIFCFAVGTMQTYRHGGFWLGRSTWVPGITLWQAAGSSLWPYHLGDSREVILGHWRYWMDPHDYPMVSYPHLMLLAWEAVTPLAFLTLSDTFRLARVRHAHLLRAAAYSLSVLPLLTIVHVAIGSADRWLTGASAWTGEQMRWAVWLLGLAWFLRYWWVVPRTYLRLPHARSVSLAMLLIGGLASLLGVLLVALFDGGS